ncbi:MAG: glycosyltransferase family 9 protein [Candidatus Omnitrophica bacterium]|nr:glycosyltransferase family 9 protein [Candidatus Omnitrophota bacterium]
MSFKLMQYLDHYLGFPLCILCGILNKLLNLFFKKKIGYIEPQKIIIMKWFGIGTNIKLVPFYHEIRKKFPRTRIVFFTFHSNKRLIELLGFSDEIRTIRNNNPLLFLTDTLKHLTNFILERVDVIIDFEFLSKFSTLFCFVSGASIKIGYWIPSFWRSSIINFGVKWNSRESLFRMYREMIKILGINLEDNLPFEKIYVSVNKINNLKYILERKSWYGEALVGINVNVSEILYLRRWPADYFIYLIENLTKFLNLKEWKIVLTGSSQEKKYTQEIFLKLSPQAKQYVIDLCGEIDLEELIALMDRLKVFISCDSGPLYLANIQDIPTISLWGPTSPFQQIVLNSERHIFFYSYRKCSPCVYEAKPGNLCNYEALCMKDIKPQDVLRILLDLIHIRYD